MYDDGGKVEDYQQLAKRKLASDLLKKNYDDASEKISNRHFDTYITKKVDSLITKGFRGHHSGEEILEALQDKKKILVSSAIDDISLQTITSIFAEREVSEDNVFFKLDDFLAVVLMRDDPTIAKEALEYLFVASGHNIIFKEKSLEDVLSKISESNEDLSGLDQLGQMYYENFFREDNTSREPLSLPSPEDVFRITIE